MPTNRLKTVGEQNEKCLTKNLQITNGKPDRRQKCPPLENDTLGSQATPSAWESRKNPPNNAWEMQPDR